MATRIFSERFDYNVGTMPTGGSQGSPWSWQRPLQNAQIVTAPLDDGPGPALGTKMFMGNWTSSDYNGIYMGYDNFDYTSEFFVRMWCRMDDDVDGLWGNKSFRFYNSDGEGLGLNSYYWVMDMEGVSGDTHDAHSVLEWVDDNIILDQAGGGSLTRAAWNKVEFYMKVAASSGGILRAWVNDSLMHEADGWSGNPANPWPQINLMSNWSTNNGPLDENNHVYWDGIDVYSDNEGGEATTGSMSDATIQAVVASSAGSSRLSLR